MNLPNFFAELKRRNVYQVAVTYAVVGWLLIQIATQVFPFFEIPNSAVRLVVLVIVIGFPIALLVAWAFELTPDGLKRTEDAPNAGPRPRRYAWAGIALTAAALSLGLFFLGRYSRPNESQAAVAAPAKSIAVLPFENLSQDQTNAYFADGIQNEILTRLSKIADLKVISRTSTQQFQSKPGNIAEIAKQLGVNTLLEGSVQKSQDSVRINVQLIKADADSHLWAETYDRKLDDIFVVESEVAQKIASALEATLTGREKTAIATVGTKNPAAYDALLRAYASSDAEPSLRYTRQALALDPDYAEAWAQLATIEAFRFVSPWRSEVSVDEVRTAAETTLRLAPELAAAHYAKGLYLSFCQEDDQAALAELQIAHEHAPNDATFLARLGSLQRSQGQTSEAVATFERAAILDPLNPDAWVGLGHTSRGLRQFDKARAMFDRALPLVGRDDLQLLCLKAETYQAQGDLDAAWQLIAERPIPSPTQWSFTIYYQQLILRRDYDKLRGIIATVDAAKEKLPPILTAALEIARGNLYLVTGDREHAAETAPQAESAMKILREQNFNLIDLSALYIEFEARLGHRKEVEAESNALLQRTRKDRWIFPHAERFAAQGYAILGDVDRALPLLKDSIEQPSSMALTVPLLRLHPSFDAIRGDPRFQKLLQEK